MVWENILCMYLMHLFTPLTAFTSQGAQLWVGFLWKNICSKSNVITAKPLNNVNTIPML